MRQEKAGWGVIKAIQTRYKGYNFRSRLEARWGVFFDALGIEWDYEPEGFELPDGTRYLPDFWLKDHGIWVEVKGIEPTMDEINRCSYLAEGTGHAALLVHGIPGTNPATLICWDINDSGAGRWEGSASVILADGGEVAIRTHNDTRVDRDREMSLSDLDNFRPVNAWYMPLHKIYGRHFGVWWSGPSIRTQRAIDAARSARFEFGQSGASA